MTNFGRTQPTNSSMGLREDLHKLIDQSENENLLEVIREILSEHKNPQGSIWKELSEEQRKDIVQAYDRSVDTSTLVKRNQAFPRKH